MQRGRKGAAALRNKRGGGTLVGGSSLLVIFAVLCLIVFALLSLSTARAGARLSRQSAQAVTAYYQADCTAEELLARLRAGELPEGVTTSENGIFSYTCPISSTQALEAEVLPDGETYIVLRWQSVSTIEWESDDTLTLWDGN